MGNIGPNNPYQQFLKFLPKSVQQGINLPPITQFVPGAMQTPNSLETLAGKMLMEQLMQLPGGLTRKEVGMLMRQIMDLPRELQTIMALLTTQQGDVKPETLKKLLEEMPEATIPLEQLQELLVNKSQDGTQKLIQLLQTNMAAYSKEGQSLKELLQLTSQASAKAASSPAEALTTLLLIYLPYHPLVQGQKLEAYFEVGEYMGEGGEEGENYTLILYIETDTLGKFHVSVGLKQQTQLFIKIEHDAVAKPFLGELEETLTGSLASDGLPPPIVKNIQRAGASEQIAPLTVSTGDDFKTFQEDKKKLAVYPAKGASVVVVTTAYQLARIIFEADDRNRLLQKRQGK